MLMLLLNISAQKPKYTQIPWLGSRKCHISMCKAEHRIFDVGFTGNQGANDEFPLSVDQESYSAER